MEYGRDNLVKFPTGFLVLTPVSCFKNIKLLLLKWKEIIFFAHRNQVLILKFDPDYPTWVWLIFQGKTICWCQTFYYFFCQARLNLGCVPEEARIIPESDIRVKESEGGLRGGWWWMPQRWTRWDWALIKHNQAIKHLWVQSCKLFHIGSFVDCSS